AWEERTAARLGTFRETGEFTLPGSQDTDAFNADIVERTRGRDGRQVIGDLDAAHERLVAEIARLDEARLDANDGWAKAIVAGNTYGHYAEHHDELHAAVPKTPAELLERVEEGWKPFRNAVANVGLRGLSSRTSAGWTVKGLLGHVTHWAAGVPAELEVRMRGGRSAPPDVDAVNAEAASRAETKPARRLVGDLDAAHASVVAALRALPQDREVPFLAGRRVAAETYEHYREHYPELRQLRPRTMAELVDRIEAEWRVFREAIRHLGRARIGEAIGDGWTYKDMLAHVSAWMEFAPQRLRDLRKGQADPLTWTPDAIDASNARAVEERRLVGPEAILDEMDAAYRRLIGEVREVSDEEIARSSHGSGVLSLFAWCSYLHFEQHYPELGVEVG
ncbi:MAG: maleylpyruvate isomerase N-terminal domain-containing protein, partial [Chloroflexota bacterium]